MNKLEEIVQWKHREVAAAKASTPIVELQKRAEASATPQNLLSALRGAPPIRLIAEVKKASPSAGLIRADFDPVSIAQTYERHGASCISVLTDERFFQGSLEYLVQVRKAVNLPVLRKDFIVDPYQVWEARVAGADAILLIAECLDDCQLRSLLSLSTELNMATLVEIYEESNLDRVLDAGADLIGVNNRDLRTFQVDVGRTLRLRERIPRDRLMVGESGIRTREDVLVLQQAGVDAMLVGESLMREADIGAAVDRLLGAPHPLRAQ